MSIEDILATAVISPHYSPLLAQILQDIPRSQIVPISCYQASIAATSPSTTRSSDPGNIQSLLQTLTTTFSSLTTPSTSDDPNNILRDPSYWEHSLGVSHRQSTNLQACLEHLTNFLALSQPQSQSTTHSNSPSQEFDMKPGETEIEMDIVASAEHLRLAANSLAKITGKDESGDVEAVLGVVFEKFCVGK